MSRTSDHWLARPHSTSGRDEELSWFDEGGDARTRVETMYTLIGADGHPYESSAKGLLGGHKGDRVYGRLDCRAAAQAIAKGGYLANRVFFADEATAVAAGYRPCAVCLPRNYAAWKAASHRFRLAG